MEKISYYKTRIHHNQLISNPNTILTDVNTSFEIQFILDDTGLTDCYTAITLHDLLSICKSLDYQVRVFKHIKL